MVGEPGRSDTCTLIGVRIWDGQNAGYLDRCDAIVVDDGYIVEVGPSEAVARRGEVVDLQGCAVVPGLIDAHVHLCLDPDIRDPQAQSQGSDEAELGAMAQRAAAMVQAGITTARDLGGGRFLELELRDRIRRGVLPGPRLVCAGQPVTSVRGHCFFWGGEAADLDAARSVIDRQAAHGVDLIKVMATGGNLTPGSQPKAAQFDEATLIAIVADARRRGYAVAAHCHGTPGIRAAAAARVSTIEHCSWVGDGGWGSDYDALAASQLAARGIWVSPTVNAGWRRHIGRSDGFVGRVTANFAAMRSAGVRLIASTDAGIPNVRHADLALALPMFSHFAGLSPTETLQAATSHAAEALGVANVTGVLGAGYSADLVVVEGDPLADLACLARPRAVMARGTWARFTPN